MLSNVIDQPKKTLFDINWFCLYLVFITIPIVEITGLYTGVQSSVPVGISEAIELLAMTLTLAGGIRLAFPSTTLIRKIIFLWFLVSFSMIIYLALKKHQMAYFSTTFFNSASLFFCMTALVYTLKKISVKYENLHSFVAGAGGLLLGALGVHGMLLLTIKKLPNVYDPVLYRFEHILGFSYVLPFFDLYSAGIFGWILYQIYSYLNIFIILAAASEFIYAPDKLQAGLVLRFLVVAAIGYGLYYLMPAIGPSPFFGALFPYHLPNAQFVARHFVEAPPSAPSFSPRNTMPSLHATWGILAFLALGHSPLWHKFLGFLLVISIFIVTIGAGQHYTVDWIVALPLVLLSRGISALALPIATQARRNAIGVGTFLLLFWVLAVRGAPNSLNYPELIQFLALASIVLPAWFEMQLAKAEKNVKLPNEIFSEAHILAAKIVS